MYGLGATLILHLPRALAGRLWSHAVQEAPRECIGALGGVWNGPEARIVTFYPLRNISPTPETQYLADPGHLMRAFKAMRVEELELVALFHSHPAGPGRPSLTDTKLAEYEVPYIIADLRARAMSAFLLPTGDPVQIQECMPTPAPESFSTHH